MVLKTAHITKKINSLRLSKSEMQILAMTVSFGERGLTASTASLADFLCINIRNTDKAIHKLKDRGLVEDIEDERQMRKLVINQTVFDAQVLSCATGVPAQATGGKTPGADDHKSRRARPQVPSCATDKVNEVKKKTKKTTLPLPNQPQELPKLFTDYQEKYSEDPHRFVSAEQQAFNERCNAAIRTETENA